MSVGTAVGAAVVAVVVCVVVMEVRVQLAKLPSKNAVMTPLIASADVAQLALSFRLPPNVQVAENPTPPKKSSSARLSIAATVDQHVRRSLSRACPGKNAGLTQEICGRGQ